MEENEPFVNMYGEYSCDICQHFFVPRAETDGRVLDTICSHCLSEEKQIAEHLREFVELIAEKKFREVQVSDGTRVKHGSLKHVKDLETRIASLIMWRDQQRRGSEARANYSRLIARLKSELASARRSAVKLKNINENYATEPEPEQLEKWQKMERGETTDAQVRDVVDMFHETNSLEELDTAKFKVLKMIAAGHVSSAVSDDFLSWLYARHAKNLGFIIKKLK